MKRVGILANLQKEIIKSALNEFFDRIKGSNYKFLAGYELQNILEIIPRHIELVSIEELMESSDLIASFGGDGTILRTAAMIADREIPIIGVNLGGLGFLTASAVEKARQHIEDFFNEKLIVEKRSLLELKIADENGVNYFLNDFVVDKAGFSRLIKIITYVDDKLLNSYTADGLIISTPTGSTAYSLANGGPIVVPLTDTFIINPICPHTLSNRPIVISDKSKISIDIESEIGKFNVFGDGQIIGTYSQESKIYLRKAEYSVNLVQTPEHEFYTILREKLGWGEYFRLKRDN
jgi:NAD+ kinase